MAAEEGIKEILLVGHGGKLIKLAAGIMNTHSSVADGRMEILGVYGALCGAESSLVGEILQAVTVDQALSLLERVPDLRERVMENIMEKIYSHLQRRAGEALRVEAVVFTNERGILGETPFAGEMIDDIRKG
jgi:cobalt-precorrin-5B (C1)-methyltransferase